MRREKCQMKRQQGQRQEAGQGKQQHNRTEFDKTFWIIQMLPLSMEQQIERIEKLSPWLARHADKNSMAKNKFPTLSRGLWHFPCHVFRSRVFWFQFPKTFPPRKGVRSPFGLLIYENILINADSWKTLSRLLLLCKFFLHLKTVWVAHSHSSIIIIGFHSFCIYYWCSVAIVPLPFPFSCHLPLHWPTTRQQINPLNLALPYLTYCSRWGCQTRQLPDPDPDPDPEARLDPDT